MLAYLLNSMKAMITVMSTLQYSTIFQAELDKHLIKYRNIYVLETKYMIIINYSILLHISV